MEGEEAEDEGEDVMRGWSGEQPLPFPCFPDYCYSLSYSAPTSCPGRRQHALSVIPADVSGSPNPNQRVLGCGSCLSHVSNLSASDRRSNSLQGER